MMRMLITIGLWVFPLFIFAQDEYEKTRIQALRHALAEIEHNDVDAVTDFEGKTEFWSFAKLNEHVVSFEVWSYQDDNLISEYYLVENGNLIFAFERQLFMPLNHTLQMMWNCAYYLSDEKVFYHISLGHGKTEDDDWQPEVIVDQYNNRVQQQEHIHDEYR